MADSEIRVGVVGTGGWTNAGHLAVYGTHPRAKLMAICDIDKDRARGAARMFDVEIVTDDYSELVNRDDIDAIDIVTPNALHSPIALAAPTPLLFGK
ncbi:MAG: Gfo/Idh/MocA family oxidoreductase [Gammaproteobacteria bacterium]|nr:Gfo/Idh/MocA family oxidoreductase [Gammaproteobacteria bacterium]